MGTGTIYYLRRTKSQPLGFYKCCSVSTPFATSSCWSSLSACRGIHWHLESSATFLAAPFLALWCNLTQPLAGCPASTSTATRTTSPTIVSAISIVRPITSIANTAITATTITISTTHWAVRVIHSRFSAFGGWIDNYIFIQLQVDDLTSAWKLWNFGWGKGGGDLQKEL